MGPAQAGQLVFGGGVLHPGPKSVLVGATPSGSSPKLPFPVQSVQVDGAAEFRRDFEMECLQSLPMEDQTQSCAERDHPLRFFAGFCLNPPVSGFWKQAQQRCEGQFRGSGQFGIVLAAPRAGKQPTECIMEEEMKQRLTRRDIWVRAIFMVIFVIAYSIAELILAVVVLAQFFIVLFTGQANRNLLLFGSNLSAYVFQVFRFQTFNSETQPFPFADWPREKMGENVWLDQAPPAKDAKPSDS